MTPEKIIEALEDTLAMYDESPSEEHTETITVEPVATITVYVDADEEAKALDIAERYEEHEKRVKGGK